MEDINELKRKRKALLDRARELVDSGDEEGVADVEALIAQADGLEKRIDVLEASSWRARTGRGIESRLGVYVGRGPVTGRPIPEGGYSNSMKETDFSIVRAIRAVINNDWRDASREREASDGIAKQIGRQSRGGFFVPEEAWLPSRQEQRDLVKGVAGSGGYLAATDVLGESFIDRLAPKSVMLSAGVRTLDGLVGDVAIPREATGPTAYWVAENVALTEGAQTFEQVALTPKTVGAFVDISRRLILQSSLDVEAMVRDDILRSLATAIDLAILQGTGTDQPTGVKGISGVTDISGTDGNTLAWSDVVDLETAIATANADSGKLAYITNPHMRGVAKQTLITATYGDKMLWQDGPTPLNGYPALVTGQIPANLGKGSGTSLSYIFFGDWSTVLLGRWSGLDVLVDPYTGGTAGTVRVIAFNDMDVAVRHPAAIVFGYYK